MSSTGDNALNMPPPPVLVSEVDLKDGGGGGDDRQILVEHDVLQQSSLFPNQMANTGFSRSGKEAKQTIDNVALV
jgi:hypothetical protein